MDNAMSTTKMTWDFDNLQSTTRVLLEGIGWSPARRVSTDRYRESNESLGMSWFEAAEGFLTNVGGLTLEYPHFANPASQSNCCFDPVFASDRANTRKLRLYERHLGCRLCVIGEENHGYLTLLMTESAMVFAGFEFDLITVGDSPASALNNLCSGRELPVVEVSRDTTGDGEYGIIAGLERALKEAGVQPRDRNTNPSGSVPQLFCTKFGGVTFACKNADGTDDICKLFATTDQAPWQCPSETREAIGEPATPVGEIVHSTVRLVMTSNGRLFGFLGELPDCVWLFGSSGEEGLNNIFLGKGGSRI